jgi:hypothetical protein
LELFDYFNTFLHAWRPNLNVNKVIIYWFDAIIMFLLNFQIILKFFRNKKAKIIVLSSYHTLVLYCCWLWLIWALHALFSSEICSLNPWFSLTLVALMQSGCKCVHRNGFIIIGLNE